jgi:phosphoglucomutase
VNYLETYEIWKKRQLEDPDLIAEMIEIEGNEQEIKERFIRMLEFGTAGLRGILGVGTNRMNIYTVALATLTISTSSMKTQPLRLLMTAVLRVICLQG